MRGNPRPSPPRHRGPVLHALVAVALVTLVAACGSEGRDDDAGTRSAPDADTSTAVDGGDAALHTGPAAEPSCADGTSAGRRYVLCTAGETSDQGLIVAVHGRGSSADDMRATTALERSAAAQGLAVVYPESLDGGWGDDTFVGGGRPAGDEDVAFLDALVGDLRADRRIGDGPVAVVGFSNGASMAMRYAATRPDGVAAVVAVAGQLPRDAAVRPTGRVPLLAIYGTADPVRPYDTGIPDEPQRVAGRPTPTLPTADSVAAFVAAAAGPPVREGPAATDPDPGDGTSLTTERWVDDDGTVAVLISVVAGGHTWPSALVPAPDGYGPVSRDLDASAEAVRFVLDPGEP